MIMFNKSEVDLEILTLVKVMSHDFNCLISLTDFSLNWLKESDFWLSWNVMKVKDLFNIWIKIKLFFFFFFLTRFNTHYESMWNSIYCSKRCASVAFFSYLLSLFSALYTVTVLNAKTLWTCFFSTFSLFHLILQWHHSLKLIQYACWEYHLNDCCHHAHDF